MEYGCLDMCKNKCCVSDFKTSQVNWCMYIILAGRSPLWEDHRFKANSSSTGLHSTPVSRNQNSPDSFGVPSTWEAEPGGPLTLRPVWSTVTTWQGQGGGEEGGEEENTIQLQQRPSLLEMPAPWDNCQGQKKLWNSAALGPGDKLAELRPQSTLRPKEP